MGAARLDRARGRAYGRRMSQPLLVPAGHTVYLELEQRLGGHAVPHPAEPAGPPSAPTADEAAARLDAQILAGLVSP